MALETAATVDVEATALIRQAEVKAAQEMILRTKERFDLYPEMLDADTAYETAAMLGRLVEDEADECACPV